VERRIDGLQVKVVDDGGGFDVARRRAGFGLHGIEERVKELGGQTTVRSVRGAGTSLRIVLPLASDVTAEEATLARAAG
jgi:signal transduction histidine kinase